MDKIEKKIIFDATVLVDGNDMKEERRGIYFVAKNLLREFNRQIPGRIILYATGYKIAGLDSVNKMMGMEAELYRKPPVYAKFLHRIITDVREKRMVNLHRPIKALFYGLVLFLLYFLSCLIFFFLNFTYRCFEDCVFFSPRTSPPAFIKKNKSVKNFIVLHDLIPVKYPETSDLAKGGWFQDLIKSLNGNDYYFAISQSTKHDFCEFSKSINPDNVLVVSWAADGSYRHGYDEKSKAAIKEKYGIPYDKRYVFALASNDARKNSARIIRTFESFVEKNGIDDLILVLGGKISEFPENENVKAVGYVSDEDLPVLYSGAEWFVFTSQYEGFGLPALEAMQCGCPAITSNNSSLPEVVGDAEIMIDWDSDEQHIEAYEKMYFDGNLRRTLSEKGLERAKDFSWNKTAVQMLNEMGIEVSCA